MVDMKKTQQELLSTDTQERADQAARVAAMIARARGCNPLQARAIQEAVRRDLSPGQPTPQPEAKPHRLPADPVRQLMLSKLQNARISVVSG